MLALCSHMASLSYNELRIIFHLYCGENRNPMQRSKLRGLYGEQYWHICASVLVVMKIYFKNVEYFMGSSRGLLLNSMHEAMFK